MNITTSKPRSIARIDYGHSRRPHCSTTRCLSPATYQTREPYRAHGGDPAVRHRELCTLHAKTFCKVSDLDFTQIATCLPYRPGDFDDACDALLQRMGILPDDDAEVRLAPGDPLAPE